MIKENLGLRVTHSAWLVMAKYALEGPWQGREKDNLVTGPRTQGSRVKKTQRIVGVYYSPGKARGGNISK